MNPAIEPNLQPGSPEKSDQNTEVAQFHNELLSAAKGSFFLLIGNRLTDIAPESKTGVNFYDLPCEPSNTEDEVVKAWYALNSLTCVLESLMKKWGNVDSRSVDAQGHSGKTLETICKRECDEYPLIGKIIKNYQTHLINQGVAPATFNSVTLFAPHLKQLVVALKTALDNITYRLARECAEFVEGAEYNQILPNPQELAMLVNEVLYLGSVAIHTEDSQQKNDLTGICHDVLTRFVYRKMSNLVPFLHYMHFVDILPDGRQQHPAGAKDKARPYPAQPIHEGEKFQMVVAELEASVEAKMMDVLVPEVEKICEKQRIISFLGLIPLSAWNFFAVTTWMNDQMAPEFSRGLGANFGAIVALIIYNVIKSEQRDRDLNRVHGLFGQYGKNIVNQYFPLEGDVFTSQRQDRVDALKQVLPEHPITRVDGVIRKHMKHIRLSTFLLFSSFLAPVAWDKFVTEPRGQAMIEQVEAQEIKGVAKFSAQFFKLSDEQLGRIAERFNTQIEHRRIVDDKPVQVTPQFFGNEGDCEEASAGYVSLQDAVAAPELGFMGKSAWIVKGNYYSNGLLLEIDESIRLDPKEKSQCTNMKKPKQYIYIPVYFDGKNYRAQQVEEVYADETDKSILKVRGLRFKASDTHTSEMDEYVRDRLNHDVDAVFKRLYAKNTQTTAKGIGEVHKSPAKRKAKKTKNN